MDNKLVHQKHLRRLLGNYKKNMAHVLLLNSNYKSENKKKQADLKQEHSKRLRSDMFFSEWYPMNE